ncbi:hypothetical protein CCR87_13130 [Rhodobaculum claviforme]|uniref:MobA-like NTP transferase domain-containing protein n=2 Tax=Rhodobaculum claviforme TaxID=1549854 RepID=A0A934TLC9_9RHOB|nr:hypothetical protein [Rhodobaculum claviforme]
MRGRDKLLEPVAGHPLLAVVVARACAAAGRVLVTLGPGMALRRAALHGQPAACTEIAGAAEGMAASVRAGAVWATEQGLAGLMVLPADMPDIAAQDLVGMVAAFQAADPSPILRATTADGRPGHPVILPARHFAAMAGLRGDAGARDILRVHRSEVAAHPLPGTRAITDLDTPEDWAAWRALR